MVKYRPKPKYLDLFDAFVDVLNLYPLLQPQTRERERERDAMPLCARETMPHCATHEMSPWQRQIVSMPQRYCLRGTGTRSLRHGDISAPQRHVSMYRKGIVNVPERHCHRSTGTMPVQAGEPSGCKSRVPDLTVSHTHTPKIATPRCVGTYICAAARSPLTPVGYGGV